jgi:WD40 repeat protein
MSSPRQGVVQRMIASWKAKRCRIVQALLVVGTVLLLVSGVPAQGPELPKALILPGPSNVWSIAVSKDGKTVVGGAGYWGQPGEVGVWDLETRKPLKRFAEGQGVTCVLLTSDAKLLAYGSWNAHFKVYDWAANKEIAAVPVAGAVRVAISPDDKLLATVTEKNTAQLWELPHCRPLADLEGDLLRFHCVAFSPDGKKVLAGGGDWKNGGVNQVTIWDVESKKQIGALVGHNNAVICMTYSPDGKMIATGSVDATIRLWDAQTGEHLKTLTGHQHFLEALAFTPDGKTLLSGSHDMTFRVWDVETGKEKEGRLTMPGSVTSIVFTPDGKSLLVGGGPRFLKILDAAGHEEKAALWSGPTPLPLPLKDDVVVFALPQAAMDNEPIAAPSPTRSRSWLLAALIVALSLLVALAIGYFLRRRRLTQETHVPRSP